MSREVEKELGHRSKSGHSSVSAHCALMCYFALFPVQTRASEACGGAPLVFGELVRDTSLDTFKGESHHRFMATLLMSRT